MDLQARINQKRYYERKKLLEQCLFVLHGQYVINQKTLEQDENQRRKKITLKSDPSAKTYNSCTPCRHGNRERVIKSGKIVCQNCHGHKKSKPRLACEEIIKREIKCNPVELKKRKSIDQLLKGVFK